MFINGLVSHIMPHESVHNSIFGNKIYWIHENLLSAILKFGASKFVCILNIVLHFIFDNSDNCLIWGILFQVELTVCFITQKYFSILYQKKEMKSMIKYFFSTLLFSKT